MEHANDSYRAYSLLVEDSFQLYSVAIIRFKPPPATVDIRFRTNRLSHDIARPSLPGQSRLLQIIGERDLPVEPIRS